MSNRDELANMKEEGIEVTSMEAKTMKEMQKEVDAYISQFKEGYFSPLAMLARLLKKWENWREKLTIIMVKSRRKQLR